MTLVNATRELRQNLPKSFSRLWPRGGGIRWHRWRGLTDTWLHQRQIWDGCKNYAFIHCDMHAFSLCAAHSYRLACVGCPIFNIWNVWTWSRIVLESRPPKGRPEDSSICICILYIYINIYVERQTERERERERETKRERWRDIQTSIHSEIYP